MNIKTLGFLLIIITSPVVGQQVPDTEFKPIIGKATYSLNTGPVIMVDESHYNFHTIDNRFKPFSQVLMQDGYRVKKGTASFSKSVLSEVSILVVANALNERNLEDWTLPNPSAFTNEEITAVQNWVADGGSLFLIADHMPFPGCNEQLAAAFGFKFYNGFAIDTTKQSGPDLFSFSNKRLAATSLTSGIDSIYSFTGQAFDAPKKAIPILILDEHFKIWLPKVAWEFEKETLKIEGSKKVQLALLEYGKGRVVVSGEGAMFSAQLAGKTPKTKVGFNNPLAKRNADFLLRIIHWLDSQ